MGTPNIYPPVEIGQEFTRWTVIEPATPDKGGRKHWMCRCQCGTVRRVSAYGLHTYSKSCGCLRNERNKTNTKTHGMTHTTEYHIWVGIKSRVFNTEHPAYNDYGGRGITMYEEWANSFEAFFAYVGLRPSPFHTIDRRDNDSGYLPGNIQWSTKKEQARNRRSSRFLTHNGETMTLIAWSERIGVSPAAILWRIKHGYTDDQLFLPNHCGQKLTS